MTRVAVLLMSVLFGAGLSLILGAAPPATPESMRTMASEYYRWRDRSYPVASSSQGLHTWDDRLTDFSSRAVEERRRHVVELLAQVRAMPAGGWAKDDRIDWLLFRSQLETVEFFDRVMDSEATNPQIYIGECSNAVFSLLKKEYAPPRARVLAATARLKAMPALLNQGKMNLGRPVALYARLAIDSARAIDPLF